jgi:two-component system, cell cycle sensor histidine kinase and response regulator CckA
MTTKPLAEQLYEKHALEIHAHTDRLFAGLMSVQWLAAIAAALWITPRTWIGTTSTTHLHVWMAIYLGGLITLLPVGLALTRPGRPLNRFVIATSQVLMSSLLIHFTGGRIETHFHVFASLVFLSFYRDWRVLIPATTVVAADHFLRGAYWPESVFGVLAASQWRWLEHAGWVVFEDVFLIMSCLRSRREMWSIAERTAALHTSEERYRAIVARAEGIFLAEAGSKRVVECNAAFYGLLGYDAEEVTGLTIYDFDAASAEDLDQTIRRFTEQRTPMNLERQYRRKDGRLIDVRLTLSALAGARDTLCGAVRDVTARRRAEQALQASEARNAAIVGAALDCIITFDGTGKIVEFNPASEHTFGCPRARALGLDIVSLVVPPRLREQYGRELSRYIGTGDSAIGGRRVEGSAQRADGTEFPAEFAFARIASDTKPLYVCFVRDLTEQKQAEEALRTSEAQLRQANKMDAIGHLAGGIAHDFNNLLTAILGYAEVVRDRLRHDAALSGYVDEIARAGQTAASLTRQLLAFSRRQMLQPAVLDLNGVIANVDKMLRRLIGEHIDLVLHLAPDLRRVRADAGQLEQVVMNLVVNARDAMKQGGRLLIETANVRLAAGNSYGLPAGDAVVLTVTDDGCGMDAATQAHIFEPFFTTKEPGKGTGLGLSTVYGIVTQSGGGIELESAVNQGTTFRIVLPVVDAGEEVATTIETSPVVGARGSETVLLVEDEQGVRMLTRLALERGGYAVLTAASPEEAIRMATEHRGRIDLVLADVIMPLMNGRELAEWLVVRYPDARVLFMSGYTDDTLIPHGVASGEMAFLHKPFTPTTLLQRVRDVLDGAPAAAGV